MKHWLRLSLITVMIIILTGCEGEKSDNSSSIKSMTEEGAKEKSKEKTKEETKEEAKEETEEKDSGKAEAEQETKDDITLEMIRSAAEESGFDVTDEHQLIFMKEVKDGISVEIIADDHDTIYSFIECETEDAAIKNAKDIDDAGYNIAIRKGRFLTCYGVDKKEGTIADILTSLLEGKPWQKN